MASILSKRNMNLFLLRQTNYEGSRNKNQRLNNFFVLLIYFGLSLFPAKRPNNRCPMFLGRSYKLIDKGLIVSSTQGKIEFALPRFKEFVQFENLLKEE